MSPRVLIVTASVGEGHDAPARTVAAQLRLECPDIEIFVDDGLIAMGRVVAAISERAPRVLFFRGGWLWDAAFVVFARIPATRGLAQRALARVGSAGLLALVDKRRPDVIVSTYPQATEVLGQLRAEGRLHVPVCAAVTDLSALWYWAAPGVDVHLITHPESIDEVREIAGPGTNVHCVHGFTSPLFLEARDRGVARAALGLPPEGRIVLVSGGGWGVGKIAEAAKVALELPNVDLVVCLCGRNVGARRRLLARFGRERRIRVEGFTDQMPDWLAAVDVLIHSTAGLTMLEAIMRGCPAISYGWGRGHIRVNNKAFRAFDLIEVADSNAELASKLANVLQVSRPAPAFEFFARLPSAASLVLAEITHKMHVEAYG